MERGWVNALELVTQARAIPVLRGKDPDAVLEVAHVLLEEGFKHLEVTFTVPEAARVIEELGKVQGAVIGAGTVLDARQLWAAVRAGAKFLVSPGLDHVLLEALDDYRDKLGDDRPPFLPGVFTPSEVMNAASKGFHVLKLFPGELGGVAHLKSLRGPFPNLHFMPTGGVTNANLQDWARAGAVCVGVGSSLTGDGDLHGIRARARELKKLLEGIVWP
jgi:2-dehydro-3-deoxyphosphogluconate aldolase/(4S)-4-hydroxy-2-oxoglutarate aldolase